MVETLLVCLLLGGVAGLLAGLLGVGGGIVIVPVLALLFQAQGVSDSLVMHLALGTSLATIVVTSLSAVAAHHRLGAINWPLAAWMAPGLMAGAVAGAWFADGAESVTLQRLFALFEIAVGIYMLAGRRVGGGGDAIPPPAELMVSGGVIGTLSSLLGIGGGTMTVPYLSWRGRAIHEAVAVSSACGFAIALAGAAGYLWTGMDAPSLPSLASGYLYWPAFAAISCASLMTAPAGARLAHRLPVAGLKRLFAVILMGIGSAMLLMSK